MAVGGMQRHSAAAIRHLAPLVDLTVFHPHPSGTLDVEVAEELQIPWNRLRGPGHYLRELWSYSCRIRDALKAREGNLDLVYAQGFAAWAYLAGRRLPIIVNPHGLEMFQLGGLRFRLEALPFRALLRYHLRHADRVVSLGGQLTELLVRAGANRTRIQVRPNAVDLARVDSLGRTMPREAGSLLFVGRLERNKGMSVLLEAARRSIALSRLYVAGDGPLRPLVQRAGGTVTYLGKLPDEELFTRFRSVSAFVLPTLGEGMPTVLLEAMACETPVIASDVGAVKSMLESSNGRIVPPGSIEKLTMAIDEILGLPEQARLEMGKAGRNRVRTHFDWPIVAAEMVRDFHDVAQGRGVTP
jgi:glycosyltransferase involved in cell wall biosynthesis